MNVLEGLDGFGSVSKETIRKVGAAGQSIGRSYGEYVRRSAERLRACGMPDAEIKQVLSQGSAAIQAALRNCPGASLPPPSSSPNLGTIVLVGGGLAAVAGLAYFLMR